MLAPIRFCLAVLGLFAFLAPSALAQDVYRGRVLDLQRQPIVGAEVVVVGEDPIQTDAAGRFELRSEDGGVAIVRGRGLASRQVMIGMPVPMLGVASGSDLGDIIMTPGATLIGMVRLADGTPVAGVEVAAEDGLQSLKAMGFGAVQVSSHAVRAEATSDARGRFILKGALRQASTLTFTKPGFARRTLRGVAVGDPLVITMQPMGTVRGRLVDKDGETTSGKVYVTYEAGHADVIDVGPGGRFKFKLEYPGRVALRSFQDGQPNGGTPVYLEGPADNVEVSVASGPSVTGRKLAVTAVDAASGKEIVEFKAAVGWQQARFLSFIEARLLLLREDAEDGQVVLDGPVPGQPMTGLVKVWAPGFRAQRAEVTWEADGREQTCKVELEPESRVVGRIVDAETGEPVAGCSIAVQPKPKQEANQMAFQVSAGPGSQAETVSSDEAGRFVFGQLGEGEHTVRVTHPSRPDAEPLVVTLEKAGESEVEVRIPKGATLDVALEGVKVQPGWKLEIALANGNGQQNLFGAMVVQAGAGFTVSSTGGTASSGNARSFDDSGKAVFEGLADGDYRVTLLVPGGSRTLRSQRIDVGTVKIAEGKDLSSRLDITGKGPGRISGKVEMVGAAVPASRLALALTRMQTDQRNRGFSFASNAATDIVMIQPDGSFSFVAAPGDWTAQLIDVATDVELLSLENPISVRGGATSEIRLPVRAAKLLLKIRGEDEAMSYLGNRISIVSPKQSPEDVFMAVSVAGFGSNTGLNLSEGQREWTLFVPTTPLEVQVWGSKLEDRSGMVQVHRANAQPAVSLDLEATPGQVNELEIVVPRW